MKNNDLSFMEKSVFNYNSSFQDKKTIIELKKEVESLKAELEQERRLNDDVKVIATVEDFSQLICERLSLDDKLKLVTALNNEIKKQQGHVKPFDKYYDKTEYIAKRIFKSKPAKKSALINSIKTMFQDELTESDIEKIIFDLQERNFIKIVDNKITYL